MAFEIDPTHISQSIIGLPLPQLPEGSVLECSVCFEVLELTGDLTPAYLSHLPGEAEPQEPCHCSVSICLGCAMQMVTSGRLSCPNCRRGLSPIVVIDQRAIALLKLAKRIYQDRTERAARADELNAMIGQLREQIARAGSHSSEEMRTVQQERQRLLETLEAQQRKEQETLARIDNEIRGHNRTRELLRQREIELQRHEQVGQQLRDDMALIEALTMEAQRLQDDLAKIHSQLYQQNDEVRIWRRRYDLLQSELSQRQLELEEAKSHPAEAPTEDWWGWIKGKPDGPGLLTRALSEFEIHERKGDSPDSSVFKATLVGPHRTAFAFKYITDPDAATPSSSSRLPGIVSRAIQPRAASPSSISSSSSLAASSSSASSASAIVSSHRRSLVSFVREAMLLRTLNHENIVKLHGYLPAPSSSQRVLMMDYVPSDLHFWMGSDRIQTEDQAARIIFQILQAVEYMHASEVVHRNLNLNSILIDPQLDAHVKIGSFRNARSLQNCPLDEIHLSEPTYRFFSPELAGAIMDNEHAWNPEPSVWKASDIWAVGVIFAEIMLKANLFDGSNCPRLLASMAEYQEIGPFLPPARVPSQTAARLSLHARLLENPRYLSTAGAFRPPSQQSVAFLLELLRPDPLARPTAIEAVSHRFLAPFGGLSPVRKPISAKLVDAELGRFARTHLGISDLRF